MRALNTKTNKSQNLYETQSMVVALAANERGTGFICGHSDGSIIRYYVGEESGAQVSGRIIQHQTIPVALAWANGYIIVAGCDRRISFYDSQVIMTAVCWLCLKLNGVYLFIGSTITFIRLFT